MARNLIMGTYHCNLNHSHSSHEEVTQCNSMEEDRQKREHVIQQENIANRERERALEHQKLVLEHERLKRESEELRLQHESMKIKHEETMAQLEIERLRLEKDKAKATKSRVCEIS